MAKAERLICPRCKKSVATKHWAPGYPGLRKHNGQDGKECHVGYVRESKDGSGRWTEG